MCGRFTQHLSWAELHRLADLIGQPRNLAPRYNIAPTTRIEVIRPAAGGDELVWMRWGLVPAWWKKALNELPSTFNARAETVAEKPMFRSAFKSRRCIIPASGFYEWTGKAGAKTPHYFSAPDGRPLAFAGLWESWRDPESDESVPSATIIVGPANAWMQRFHDRMPVILDWRDAGAWMTGDDPGALLRPAPEDALQEWVVSSRVNRSGVGDDDPALIEAVAAACGAKKGGLPLLEQETARQDAPAQGETLRSLAERQPLNAPISLTTKRPRLTARPSRGRRFY